MTSLLTPAKEYLLSQLGKCTTCMRLAFASAFAAVLLALGASFFAPGWPAILAWFAAFALLQLWVAHVAMFVRRSVRATAIRDGGDSVEAQQAAMWPRRKIFAAFVGTLLFSAMPFAFARNAHAQSCNCATDQGCRCPPAFPNCIFNPARGEAICCGPNTRGCAGQTMTWCCPPRSDCSGREGFCEPWP